MTAEGPPVDFYAASLAVVAVVLFAKFVTHRGHVQAGSPPRNRLHRACIATAWIGLVLSMIVLGSLPSGGLEVALRWTVGLVVVMAATILAVDVGRHS
jgi:hypothetical protein